MIYKRSRNVHCIKTQHRKHVLLLKCHQLVIFKQLFSLARALGSEAPATESSSFRVLVPPLVITTQKLEWLEHLARLADLELKW